MATKAPGLARLRSVICHEGVPGPVPFIEHDADPEIIEAVLGTQLPPADSSDRKDLRQRVDLLISFYRRLGYDYVPIYVGLDWARGVAGSADTASLSRGQRVWYYTTPLIRNWNEFETYSWPDPAALDPYMIEYLYRRIPDDMGVYAQGWGGIFEWANFIMGFEEFSVALYDQPDLIEAMFEKIADIVVRHCHATLDVGKALAFTVGDDMGYNSGLMVNPEVLRKYVFPGHKKMAALCHERGIPYLLHSCGDLSSIMEELVSEVGIDGKHSFQDNVIPVEKFHATWGQRISVLGGADMDLLARGTEEDVRRRTKYLLERIGGSGSWCLGTGNTVANYIPLRNYLAMLDEGRKWNSNWG